MRYMYNALREFNYFLFYLCYKIKLHDRTLLNQVQTSHRALTKIEQDRQGL
jgi:hypothetical protein